MLTFHLPQPWHMRVGAIQLPDNARESGRVTLVVSARQVGARLRDERRNIHAPRAWVGSMLAAQWGCSQHIGRVVYATVIQPHLSTRVRRICSGYSRAVLQQAMTCRRLEQLKRRDHQPKRIAAAAIARAHLPSSSPTSRPSASHVHRSASGQRGRAACQLPGRTVPPPAHRSASRPGVAAIRAGEE